MVTDSELGIAEAPMAPHAAIEKFQRGPAPNWVDPIDAPEDGDREGGISWLLLDEQFDVSEFPPKRFVRIVKRANNSAGADEMAEIQITFNPSYESLTLHEVTVERSGDRFDALDDGDIDVMRVERDMYARVYHGDYVAIIQVRGIQSGDIINCSYTIEGANPVLGGRTAFQVGHTFDQPLSRRYFRVRNAPGSGVGIVNVNSDIEVRSETVGGFEETRVDLHNLPRRDFEYWVPAEFDKQVSLTAATSFATWQDVASWAAELYTIDPDDPTVAELVGQFQQTDDRSPALAAIAYVQERIRYVSTNFGEGGYRPRSPKTTLYRGYGDCKDKAVLLVGALRRLGHSADVALVDSMTKMGPLGSIPGPGAFNHVIVRAVIDGAVHWIDATMNGQRGPLGTRDGPHSMAALLASADATDLVKLPGPASRISHSSKEVIDMSAGIGEPVVVTDDGVSSGNHAEEIRRLMLSQGETSFRRFYEDINSQEHGDLEYARFEVEDDHEANAIRLSSEMRLDDPWYRLPDGSMTFRRTLCHATELLPAIATNRRQLPMMALSHPMHHVHQVEVKLPKKHRLRDSDDVNFHCRNPAFEFNFRQTVMHRSLDIKAELKTLAGYVPADEVLSALRDQTIVQNAHILALTFGPKRGWFGLG